MYVVSTRGLAVLSLYIFMGCDGESLRWRELRGTLADRGDADPSLEGAEGGAGEYCVIGGALTRVLGGVTAAAGVNGGSAVEGARAVRLASPRWGCVRLFRSCCESAASRYLVLMRRLRPYATRSISLSSTASLSDPHAAALASGSAIWITSRRRSVTLNGASLSNRSRRIAASSASCLVALTVDACTLSANLSFLILARDLSRPSSTVRSSRISTYLCRARMPRCRRCILDAALCRSISYSASIAAARAAAKKAASSTFLRSSRMTDVRCRAILPRCPACSLLLADPRRRAPRSRYASASAAALASASRLISSTALARDRSCAAPNALERAIRVVTKRLSDLKSPLPERLPSPRVFGFSSVGLGCVSWRDSMILAA